MKFVFDRAVKDLNQGYPHIIEQTFAGRGVWEMPGIKFNDPMDWFEHAKKTGRALGITECEYAILPSDKDNKKFVFSFKHEADYIAFTIATLGNVVGSFKRNIYFNSPEECSQALPKLINFLEQNEISANIVNSGDPLKLRVITGFRFDDFAITQACNRNLFASKKPDDVSPPPAPL
jgi:hypothetical protein